MDYLIRDNAKMRQQEIQQEFNAIHRARMSRPEGLNKRYGEAFRDLRNVLFAWCCHLMRRCRRAWSAK